MVRLRRRLPEPRLEQGGGGAGETYHSARRAGRERIIPIDREGRFYIDWSLTSHDRRIRQESAHSLLLRQRMREIGQTNEIASIWRDKIAIIGSIASGNDLADYGATPLRKGTYLTSRFWNTANSLIIDR